jgi:hypothetical protein
MTIVSHRHTGCGQRLGVRRCLRKTGGLGDVNPGQSGRRLNDERLTPFPADRPPFFVRSGSKIRIGITAREFYLIASSTNCCKSWIMAATSPVPGAFGGQGLYPRSGPAGPGSVPADVALRLLIAKDSWGPLVMPRNHTRQTASGETTFLPGMTG